MSGVTDDVGQQVLLFGLGHHLALHGAGLNEVGIVLVGFVRRLDNFSGQLIGRIGVVGRVHWGRMCRLNRLESSTENDVPRRAGNG